MKRTLTLALLLASCTWHVPAPQPWTLEALTFTGAGFRAVELDGYGTAAGPHWPLRSRPPLIAEDVPEHYRLKGAPLAYLAGSTPAAELVARVPRSWAGEVRVSGSGQGWTFAGTGTARDGELRARAVADRAVPHAVAHEPDWRLRWRAEHAGEPIELGTSSAQLFVLLAEPRGPLLHTALHIVAQSAGGASAGDSVVRGVWSTFARGDVRRARDGRALRYYGEYLDGAPAELRRLLISGTGQCVAWSHLLYAALAAHGVDAEVIAVHPPEGGLLLIAPWRFLEGTRFIESGANGVSETEPRGDDVAIIARGRGVPHSRIWAPAPLPIGRVHGDDTLAYMVGRNGLADTFVDTTLALPLLARGFGLEQQRAYELEPGASITARGDDVIAEQDGTRFVLTGANGVLETERQPGMKQGRARGTSWDPAVGQGSTTHEVQGALPRGWPLAERGGDDRDWGWYLTTGADGVSQTRGARPGEGQAHAVAIGAGADGVLQSVPAGDDRVLDLAEYLAPAPASYGFVSPFNAWPEPGAGAQQNPWPPTSYPMHVLVRIGEWYYDPSFGRGPFRTPLDWERALLAGVAERVVRDGAALRAGERLIHAVRRSDGRAQLTRVGPLPAPR